MTGRFSENTLPHYLRKENYEKIKANIGRLKVFKGTISEAFDKYKDVQFDAFNLSDIFEYMDDSLFMTILDEIVKARS